MSKITNLSRARKDRARRAKRETANENAVKFGRTKAQKALEEARAGKAARDHDAHRKE